MSLKRVLIASLLILCTLVLLRSIMRQEDRALKKPFRTFPKKIGEWVGEEERFEDRVYEVLGVDDSFLCTYTDTNGHEVQLYIGYHASQREGDLIHSPKHCFPGAGWDILEDKKESLTLDDDPQRKIAVRRLLVANGPQRQMVLYWFQSRGRFIESEYRQKVYLVLDSISKKRTDGSFVRLMAPIQADRNETLGYLRDFARRLVPILEEYIPS